MKAVYCFIVIGCCMAAINADKPRSSEPMPKLSCANILCTIGKRCIMRKDKPVCVDQCKKPCRLGKTCQRVGTSENFKCQKAPKPRCAQMFCGIGKVCVEMKGAGYCKDETASCVAKFCPKSRMCVEKKKGTKCVRPRRKCPPPTGFGICVYSCKKNGACKGNKLCCSNGCGHQCMDPVYYV